MLRHLLALLLILVPAAGRAQTPDVPASVAPLAEALQRDLGLQISYRLDPYRPHTARSMERSDQRPFVATLRLVDEELRRHAPAFITNAGIRKLVFVRDLHSMQVKQAIAFNADTEALVLDVRQIAQSPTYARQMLHHELFHLVEEEFSGSFWFADPKWLALNPPTFRYGGGGMNANRRAGFDASKLTHPSPGFINLYSRTGPEEDRAEIFATLFVPEDLAIAQRWAGEDERLAGKLAYMRSYVAWWSVPRDREADEAYRAVVKAMGRERRRSLGRLLASQTQRRVLEHRGPQGWTLLHWAAAYGWPLATLLEAGADPNAADDEGWTPLHVAVWSQQDAASAIRLLLQHGADPSLRDNTGRTPVDWGKIRGIRPEVWEDTARSRSR